VECALTFSLNFVQLEQGLLTKLSTFSEPDLNKQQVKHKQPSSSTEHPNQQDNGTEKNDSYHIQFWMERDV